MYRVRFSRWLGRTLCGQDVMLSALADRYGWRSRALINALFFDSRHCARASEWEALSMADDTQDPLSVAEGGFVDDNRRAGRL